MEAEAVAVGRRWPTVGGHPALDLANTVSWRLDPSRRVDRLTSFEQLTDWTRSVTEVDVGALEVGPLDPADGTVTRALASVRQLRDAFTGLLDCQLAGRPLTDEDRRVVEAFWRHAVGRSRLGTELPMRWGAAVTTPSSLVDALALLVGGFLSSGDVPLLRRCAGEGCGWLFLDRTRNHSRRWCDPADCGNRTRVRRYTERQSRASV